MARGRPSYPRAITLSGVRSGAKVTTPRANVRGGRPSTRKLPKIVSPAPLNVAPDRGLGTGNNRFTKPNAAPGEQPAVQTRRVG